ncbi:hypothetical protein RUM44_011237 [Polyplax serrata]|uniref:C2H2-type domain-containing protein n=1 Tax=Polyplax serrata TaxID=468196 RepID=A0ABR1APG0_POLSC
MVRVLSLWERVREAEMEDLNALTFGTDVIFWDGIGVVQLLQSVFALESSARAEALEFLRESASNFGLHISEHPTRNGTKGSAQTESSALVKHNVESDKDYQTQENSVQFIDKSCNSVFSNASLDSGDKTILKKCVKFLEPENDEVFNNSTNKCDSKFCTVSNLNDSKVRTRKSRQKNSQSSEGLPNLEHMRNKNETETIVQPSIDNETVTTRETCETKKETVENVDDVETENETLKCPGCMVTCETKQLLFQHFTSHGKASLSCRLCRSNFSNMLHFWKHQKKNECKLSLFKCMECGEKFKYRRHYLKHLLGHNDNNCRYCDEKFSTWVLYKHHLKEKHPDIKMDRDLIPCKFCAMSFRRHLGLYNHYQVEHSKGKFVCLSCGLLLPTKEKYKEHVLVHESEKLWKCKICKMKFYRRQQLLFHVSVHKSGTYRCLTCDITVTSKVDLYKHKKDGHEVKGLEPKFECEICHKNFKKKVVLKNHMATHSKEKKFYCKYCVKSFGTLDALQKHQKRKSHFEKAKIIMPESKYEKVYEDKLICESCGKQYKTQRELTWHLRVHKGTYECEECGKTFTLKVNLKKHIRLHGNKVCVVCELCGNTFNQMSALNEHMLMKHSDVRNAECQVCKKKFKRKSELNRHMRIHEQKRPFVCFCGTAFKQSSHLQTHYKTFHEKNNQGNNLIQTTENLSQVYNEAMVDRQKQMFVSGEQQTNLLTMGNMEAGYGNAGSFETMQVSENMENGSYGLRYSQGEMEPINVTYEELNFEGTQQDKRELVFTSPAIDLSLVAMPEVVESGMSLGGHRDMAESCENFNKLPDDASNLQLVNLSEHIVQEYLLDLP